MMATSMAKKACRTIRVSLLLTAVTLIVSGSVVGAVVTKEEMRNRDQWVGEWLTKSGSQRVPFSFVYGGKPGGELLKAWSKRGDTRKLDEARTEHTFTWTDPVTRLEVRCVAVEYADFPVVEWTVYFKNSGRTDAPILSEIQALDVGFERRAKVEFRLHYIDGDAVGPGYTPRLQPLGPGAKLEFSPGGGRPTSGSFPYYNLDWDGQGVIIVVGWSGQWA